MNLTKSKLKQIIKEEMSKIQEYEERQAVDKEEEKVKEEADKKLGQQIAINDQRLSTITKLFEARKLIGERDSKIPKWEDALTKARIKEIQEKI